LIETFNKEWVLHDMDRVALVERGDDLLVDKFEFDEESKQLRSNRITVRSDKVTRTKVSWRLYEFDELTTILQRCGFDACLAFGEGGSPLRRSSARMLVVAPKL
jgi:hypothetical protein